MGTTEKKNRAQRDEKESTGSVDNGSGNNDTAASLQARRAKLRNALGAARTTPASFGSDPIPPAPAIDPFGQSDPYGQPDPYGQQDPYGTQPDQYTQEDQYNQQDQYAQQDPYGQQAQSGQQDPYGQQTDPYGQTNYATTPSAYEQPDYLSQEIAAQAETSGQVDYVPAETPVNVYGVPVSEEPVRQEPAPTKKSRRSGNTGAVPVVTSSTFNANTFEAAPNVSPPPAKSSASEAMPVVADKTIELVNSIDQSLNVCATNLAALQNLAGEQTDVLKGLTQTLQNQTLLEIGLNLNSLTESLTAALEPMKAIGELVPALDSLVTALEGREHDQNEKMSPEQLVTSLADQLSAGLIDPWTFKCAYMAVYPSDNPADLLHRLVELLGSQRLSGDLFRAAYEAVQAAEPPRSSLISSAPSGNYSGVTDENLRSQLEALDRSNREMHARMEEREQELSRMLAQKEAELNSAQAQLNEKLEELNNRYADAADMISSREEEFRAAIESKDMDLIEKDAELNMLRAQMEELRSETEQMVKELQREMIELKHSATNNAVTANTANNAPPQAAPAITPSDQGFFGKPGQGAAPVPGPAQGGGFFGDPAPKPGFQSDSGQFGAQSDFAGREGYVGSGSESGGFGAASPQPSNVVTQQTPFTPPQPTFQAQPPVPQPTFTPPQPAQVPAPPQPGPAPQRTAPGPTPPTTPFGGQSGSYGMGVRQQVFEVIVRQALAGAPWREICAGPMQVNNISPDEVESEVKRRQAMLNQK